MIDFDAFYPFFEIFRVSKEGQYPVAVEILYHKNHKKATKLKILTVIYFREWDKIICIFVDKTD